MNIKQVLKKVKEEKSTLQFDIRGKTCMEIWFDYTWWFKSKEGIRPFGQPQIEHIITLWYENDNKLATTKIIKQVNPTGG